MTSMVDAVPSPPPLIFVHETRSDQPAIFLGFMAVGASADKAKLEKRATELKFPVGNTTNDKDEPELMVMFPPGTDHSAGLQLYRDAVAGKFGALKLEAMIITKDKASDGIDVDQDATAVPPAEIRLPGQ
jgi:hypothetical protein